MAEVTRCYSPVEVRLFRYESIDLDKEQAHISCPACYALSRIPLKDMLGQLQCQHCPFTAQVGYNAAGRLGYDEWLKGKETEPSPALQRIQAAAATLKLNVEAAPKVGLTFDKTAFERASEMVLGDRKKAPTTEFLLGFGRLPSPGDAKPILDRYEGGELVLTEADLMGEEHDVYAKAQVEESKWQERAALVRDSRVPAKFRASADADVRFREEFDRRIQNAGQLPTSMLETLLLFDELLKHAGLRMVTTDFFNTIPEHWE